MLDIVIVNYNTGPLLRECIASLAAVRASSPPFRLIVVDNASSDDSMAGVEALFDGVLLLLNAYNRGFGAACNQGAAEGQGEHLLFLNPDTRVYADTLQLALAGLEAAPAVGIVGVTLLDETGRRAVSCSRLPRLRGFVGKALGLEGWAARRGWSQPMREWAHDQTCEVEQVMGAFLLLRRSLFQTLTGFDERFFVYFEEVDLCARARALGWNCLFLADACAFHKGCGSSERLKAHRLFYSLRSRLLYGAKHFAAPQAWLLLPLTLLLEPVARAVQLLLRRDVAGLQALLQGSARLWADLPAWSRTWMRLRRERRVS